MIDATFVEFLAQEMRRPRTLGEDRVFAPAGWVETHPTVWTPGSIRTGTLGSVVEYLKENRDRLDLKTLCVHVVSPEEVKVIGPAGAANDAEQCVRPIHVEAVRAFTGTSLLKWGSALDAETFIVALQAQFVQSEVRDQLLALVGSIKESGVRETVDDGYSQSVTSGRGVALVGSQKLPNPIMLAPFRTFAEVSQPISPFVLRAYPAPDSDRPRLALFEADGGRWQLEAIRSVATWLDDALGEIPVPVLL